MESQMIKKPIIRSTMEDQDRLTSLPDNLISEILLLLPLETAATTSVLSTQWWRNPLWTHRAHLNFEFEKYDYSDDFKVYMSVVDYILKKLTSPKFLTFKLHNFPHPVSEGECCTFYAYLHSWFSLLAARNVEKISLRSNSECGEGVWLPSTLFEIQSLVELVIWGDKVKYDLRSIQEHIGVDLQLPNLKKIELHNMIITKSHESLMKTLWKSCPRLEHLYLEFNLDIDWDDACVYVTAPNLKFLEVNFVHATPNNWNTINIDASQLEAVKFSGGYAMYDFQEKPPSVLSCANIAFDSSWVPYVGDDDDGEQHMMLFKGISGARSLCLAAWTFAVFSEIVGLLDVYEFPGFPNLVDLTVIFFSREYMGTHEMKLPVCLLANVKIIKISKCYDWDDKEIKLIGDLLSNAPLLEQLLVYSSFGDCGKCGRKDQQPSCNDYSVCTSLFMLPRVSPICEIEFFGCCDAPKDGKLSCDFIDRIAMLRPGFVNITADDQASGT